MEHQDVTPTNTQAMDDILNQIAELEAQHSIETAPQTTPAPATSAPVDDDEADLPAIGEEPKVESTEPVASTEATPETTNVQPEPVSAVSSLPDTPKQTIEVHGKWSKPLPTEKIDPTKEQLALPSDFYNRMEKFIEILNNPESRLVKMITNANKAWLEDLLTGAGLIAKDDGLVGSTTRKGSHFTNRPDDNGNGLRPGYPNINKSNGKPQGNEAVRLMSKLMGKGPGMSFTFPLWHTGIWLTVEAPSEISILELHRVLSTDMINIGNDTYGYAFSNYRSFTTKRLVDFVLSHVSACSLNTTTDLRDIILLHDLESLVYGIVCSIYPMGFQYTRSCMAKPEECKTVHEELLNLHMLLTVDKLALTNSQKEHMRKMRKDSMTLEEVKLYQSQHTVMNSKELILRDADEDMDNGISISVRVPTVSEHISAGQAWIEEMADIISVATEDSLDEEGRRNYMVNASKATIMRQYTHMVESMRIGNNIYNNRGTSEEALQDKDTIAKMLNSLSADDEIMRKFLADLAMYNADTALAVIGIPSYTCSGCGEENGGHLKGAFTNLIPIDMFQTFFGLLVQRVQRIRIR